MRAAIGHRSLTRWRSLLPPPRPTVSAGLKVHGPQIGRLAIRPLCFAAWFALIFLNGACGMSIAGAQTRPIDERTDGTSVPTSPADATSQPPAEPAAENTIEGMLQSVKQRLEQLPADVERSQEARDSLAKLYEQIRADLEAANKAQQKRRESSAAAQAAPQLLEEARAREGQIKKSPPTDENDSLEYMSFEEGGRKRQALEAELAAVAAERAALSERTTNREKRRKELPQLISETRAKLEQLNATAPPTTAASDPVVAEAAILAREASRRAVAEQLRALESEQRLYEAETFLLPLQLELAQQAEKRLQDRLRNVNEQLAKIRADRILNRYSEVKDLMPRLPAADRESAEVLLERIEKWMELANKDAQIKTELESARSVLDRWKERRDRMQARIEPPPGQDSATGFNSWVGLMLRKQRNELPDTNLLRSRIRYFQSEMQQADSLLFEIEDALAELKNKKESREAVLARGASLQLGAAESEDDPARLLVEKSEEVLDAMKIDVNAYLSDLYDVADVRENTIELAEAYKSFIDKHVLWIRSSEPITAADWQQTMGAFRWFVDYENWRGWLYLLLNDATHNFGWYLLFVLGMVFLLTNQARLRRTLGDYSARAEKNSCVDFQLTARSMLVTLLIATPVPLLFLFIYWRTFVLAGSADGSGMDVEFATSLAHGFVLATALFFPAEVLRQLCRLGGLGIKHFGWPEKDARKLATNLRWFIDFAVPLTVIIGLFLSQSNSRWESSLGRLAFIVMMLLVSMFLARIFLPSSGIVSGVLKRHEGGWLDRLKVVWYPVLFLFPLVLAVVSIVGFHYTAQRIAQHLLSSLWMVVLLTVCYCLMTRWLVLNRRKIMLAQARQRLEEASRREAKPDAPPVEEAKLDLVAINEQTRRLVNSLVVTAAIVMAYFIWSDVLPAVSVLDNFPLWEVEGSLPDETMKITLANLVLVLPLIVLLVIAGRNVPGLLEIVLLQHLPLTSAARYAITSISRYVIIGLGIVIASSTLGLRWSNIQWLVAALGVGLGFGLQEIFANFVSGLILLFEQPIRVGDIISIDGTAGTVTKIRMRATTIVNWERQELMVPNKDLITGKLLNWTLTDSTNRITINVGVAYGTDTIRAREIILDVCDQDANVLKEPSPIVTFEGFGDNSLNLVVRCYLDSLENRLLTIHNVHQQIYSAFNSAGIEIAFPQRDLHIRSLPESLTRLLTKGPNSRPLVASSASDDD